MGIIRVLLAIAVVVGHASSVVPNRAPKMTGGTASVEMFYMISGFYMAMVLNRKYRGPGSTWVFYMNRLLRLYPTYLAVLLLTLISRGCFFTQPATS
jgi:peptidoglycan/LPS O-acetylase OafA/YrhL